MQCGIFCESFGDLHGAYLWNEMVKVGELVEPGVRSEWVCRIGLCYRKGRCNKDKLLFTV